MKKLAKKAVERVKTLPVGWKIFYGAIASCGILFGNGFLSNMTAHLVNNKVAEIKMENMQDSINRNSANIEQNSFHLETLDTTLQQVITQTAVIEERTKHTADDVKIIKEHLLRNP